MNPATYPPEPPVHPLAAEMGLVRIRPWMLKHLGDGEKLYAFKNFDDDYLWDGHYDGQKCVFRRYGYCSFYVEIKPESKTKTIIFAKDKSNRLYSSSEHVQTLALRKKIYEANNNNQRTLGWFFGD